MRSFFVALLIFASPSLCFAWGGEGHQLIALIAENQLTPQARAAVKELLDGGNISDAVVASWADEIRRERRTTADWHYVNIPHDADRFDAKRDGRKGENVIDKTNEQVKILADRAQPREKRVEALKWVVHLIGDLHQPLHCADRNGDRGGSTRLVFFLDRRKADSLHYVWDTALVRELVGRRPVVSASNTLTKSITKQQLKEWSAGVPLAWAEESHRVAVEKVYLAVREEGDPPKLGRDFVEKATPVVTTQIARAGVRLAYVLNATFK